MTQYAFGVILPIVNSIDKILFFFGLPQAGSRLLRLNQHTNASRT